MVVSVEGGEWGRGADRTRAEAASATLVEAVGLAGETRMASCCCCYKANLEQVRVVACSEKAWERWARRRGEGEEVGNPRLSMLGPIGWRRPSARVKQVNGRSLKRRWADMLLYLDERICVFSGNCWSDNNGVGWDGGVVGLAGGSIVVTSGGNVGQLTQLRLTGTLTGTTVNNQ